MGVTSEQTIRLNGYEYTILDRVKGSIVDPFATQIAIGEQSYSNRKDLSSLAISGINGIGVENMKSAYDVGMCYWTDMITEYQGHNLPPRLATEISTFPALGVGVHTETLDPSGAGTTAELTGDYEDVSDDSDATYLVKNGTGINAWFKKTFAMGNMTATPAVISSVTIYGRFYGAGGGVWNGTGNYAKTILRTHDTEYAVTRSITDGVWNNFSTAYTTNPNTSAVWTLEEVNALEAGCDLYYHEDEGHIIQGRCSEVWVVVTYHSDTTSFKLVHFNGHIYCSRSNQLMKMNSGRTAFTNVKNDFAADIANLISSLNSRLYIYLGDSDEYWGMETDESFTETNVADAYWAFQHDNKLFKCNTSGTVTYSTDPESATPTWSAGGTISDVADQIQGFVNGRDAAGAPGVYCITKTKTKILDLDTPQWNDTELVLSNHPNGGKGHTYINGKVYLSEGLSVIEYDPSTGGYPDIGLTTRDGLPADFNGEIVKMYGNAGLKRLFALVDASQTTGNSKSGLYVYNGTGWYCWWRDTANDGAMHDVIVSSAESAYAVYWDCGGSIFYIDIPRGVQNPDKISQSYATSGIFVSPWFDANDGAAKKLAKYLDSYIAGASATETVKLYYRINHTTTALDLSHGSAYWTLLATYDAAGDNGANSETFASGVGAAIYAIQFRIDFVTGGSTSKSDVKSLKLRYGIRTGSIKKRYWTVRVITDGKHQNIGAKEQVVNLVACCTSDTDVAFSYRANDASDEEYYVTASCPNLDEGTGRNYEDSIFTLKLEER